MTQYGILVDYEYCTGCFSCEVACQSEHTLELEQWGVKVLQNGPWPIKGTDRYVYDCIPSFTLLCDMCEERTGQGKKPSCVHHCQAECMKYGSVSELAEDLARKPWQYLWVPPHAHRK
jgi:anaerobic dimethyl sulfoxide reductase subunit B (iron-sulfur subunit)